MVSLVDTRVVHTTCRFSGSWSVCDSRFAHVKTKRALAVFLDVKGHEMR